MFTELVLAVELVPSVPLDVVSWIKYLIDPEDASLPSPIARPSVPLFRESTTAAPEYLQLFRGRADRFIGAQTASFTYSEARRTWHLTIRSALRNYQREVESLLLWLTPYVAPNGYAGYFRSENDRFPSLISYPQAGKLVVIDHIDDMIARLQGEVRALGEEEDS